MTLPDREVVKAWIGARVLDDAGEEIGTCRTVFADDDTGASEWLSVDLSNGDRAMVPILGAREEDGSVRVAFPRRLVDSAPAAAGVHLSVEEEKRLYSHYGVPYSTSASASLLPTAAEGSDEPSTSASTQSRTITAPPAHRAPSARTAASVVQSPKVAGPLAALVLAAVAVVFRRRRAAKLRRRPLTRLEAVTTTSRGAALRAAPMIAAGAEQVRAGAGPVVRRAGDGLLRGSLYTAALGSLLGQRAAPPVRRAGAEGLRAGRSAARTAGSAGTSAARTAGGVAVGVGMVAAEGALRGGRVAGASALRGGRVAAAKASSTGSKARAVPRAARAVPRAARAAGARGVAPVGKGIRRVRKTSRKVVNRSLMAGGLSVGYVLGARAGRERYDEIVTKAREAARSLRGGSPHPSPMAATPTRDEAVAATSPASGAPVGGGEHVVDLTQTAPDAMRDSS